VDARIFKRLLADDGVALANLSLYVEDPIGFLSATQVTFNTGDGTVTADILVVLRR
jgi:hypothetical protein